MSASLEYLNTLMASLFQQMQRTYLAIQEHKRLHRAPYADFDSTAKWNQSCWDDYGDLGAAWDEVGYEEAKWDEEEEIDIDMVMADRDEIIFSIPPEGMSRIKGIWWDPGLGTIVVDHE